MAIEFKNYTPPAPESSSGFKKTKFAKMKEEGDYQIRVLPAADGVALHKVHKHVLKAEDFVALFNLTGELEIKVHEIFEDNKSIRYGARFACPNKHGGKFCIACDKGFRLLEKAKAEDDDLLKTVARRRLPRQRGFANIIIRGQESEGPQVWEFTGRLKDDIDDLADPNKGGEFWNPNEEGLDLFIKRTGQGLDTEWGVVPARKNSPLSEDEGQAREWIENQYDLTPYITPKTPKEVLEGILEIELPEID